MSIKKYSSGQWVDVPYRKYETATDTITTLPTEIIGDGTNASAVIKGNLTQSGTHPSVYGHMRMGAMLNQVFDSLLC